MAKIKLINMEISAGEYDQTLTRYLSMGFELVNSNHYSGIRFSGSGDGSSVNVTPSEYNYYKCLFKFDMEQKNGQQLWENYKKYKKKIKELDDAYGDKCGNSHLSGRVMFVLTVIIGIIAVPFFPMLLGDGFGDFYRCAGWLGFEKKFDYPIFFLAIFEGLVTGFVVGLSAEAIRSAVLRKKRVFEAIEKIPRIEKEIEDLISESCVLRNS